MPISFSFQSTTFHVVYKNIPAALTLHWTDGFLLKPFASPTFAFTYSFSQLKGSSGILFIICLH